MARLPTTINFPSVNDVVEGRRDIEGFLRDFISVVQYWLQRLIRRTNDELLENFGTQTVNLELVLSGATGKLGINAATRLTKLMSLTATLAPGLIAANSSIDTTLTFTGVVAATTEITAHPSSDPEGGLIWMAWPSAADTVKIRLFNVTGAPITPAARTWRVSARIY